MNERYLGVYWIARKDQLPEDESMCVFHIKGTKDWRIHFGAYSERLLWFFDEIKSRWYDQSRVDYWMPIPILPTEEGVKE